MNDYHIPVLLAECLKMLNINPSGTYVDLTFGGGGHSRAIIEKLNKRGSLIAFDQDADAEQNRIQDSRFSLIRNNFKFFRGSLRAIDVESVDGILVDLGVSSHHFNTAERGFSFRFDAPLDMRMNQSAVVTAADVINNYSVERLAHIFGEYGELKGVYRMANAIAERREQRNISSIEEFLEVMEPFTPRREESKFRAKLFQALRIEVNGEMQALEMMLEQSVKVLKKGGRMVVLTYHSLEDRRVKNFLRSGGHSTEVEKDFYGNIITPFELITRRPIEPSEQELEKNPRSRSARLRCGERL